MIPPTVVIPYDGTHASIPTGWTRRTDFDDRVLKSATSAWGDTGGATTHNHSCSHNHAISAHVHSVTLTGRVNGTTQSMGNSGGQAEEGHSHSASNTGAVGGETCQTTNVTFDSVSNFPLYYEVIFIESSVWNLIPAGGMIFRNGDRSEMTYHTASENRFLKGATTGGNAGGTGGSATHSHTQSHTHTANTHTHATSTSGTVPSGGGEDGGGSAISSNGHTHTITVNSNTQNMNANTDNSGSTSTDPLHITLKHYVATAPSRLLPGDIAITTESTNPIGWNTCDGTNGTPDMGTYYVKNTTSAGVSGGANTHSHSFTHSHTGNGTHTHTAAGSTGSNGLSGGRNGSGKTGVESHVHNVSSVSSVTANYDNSTTVSTTENSEPPYIKVRFIQLEFDITGGFLPILLK